MESAEVQRSVLSRGAWWLPLLIPAMVTPAVVISQISRGRHVIQWNAFSVIVGWVLIALWMGVPCFFAGVRLNRSRRDSH